LCYVFSLVWGGNYNDVRRNLTKPLDYLEFHPMNDHTIAPGGAELLGSTWKIDAEKCCSDASGKFDIWIYNNAEKVSHRTALLSNQLCLFFKKASR
jgi:hypothetical protein